MIVALPSTFPSPESVLQTPERTEVFGQPLGAAAAVGVAKNPAIETRPTSSNVIFVFSFILLIKYDIIAMHASFFARILVKSGQTEENVLTFWLENGNL